MQKVKMADYCRPEIAGDIISGGIKEDIELNLCQFWQLQVKWFIFAQNSFFQNGHCYRAEVDDDVIFGVNVGLSDMMTRIKFGDIWASRFGEKSLNAKSQNDRLLPTGSSW